MDDSYNFLKGPCTWSEHVGLGCRWLSLGSLSFGFGRFGSWSGFLGLLGGGVRRKWGGDCVRFWVFIFLFFWCLIFRFCKLLRDYFGLCDSFGYSICVQIGCVRIGFWFCDTNCFVTRCGLCDWIGYSILCILNLYV